MNQPALPSFYLQTGITRERVETTAPREFHRRLPDYSPTPLIEAPSIACALGIGQLLIKNESLRLGLPAFKILGASWAIYRALERRLGKSLEPWHNFSDLVQKVAPLRPLTFTTATDGNHGRAVAHVAALFGFDARIYMPAASATARIEGIASEGAQVIIVKGTYDDAVARVAAEADANSLVISDTSWPGYEEVPRWVMEGYSTIFSEIDEELERRSEASPDLIVVQFGVGALAAAVVRHGWPGAKIVSVEPLSAACGFASAVAGEIVTIPGPHNSIMAGMNCGRASLVAWPIVARGIDAFLAISNERARDAMRRLASIGVVAGETGAAGLAGLIELLTGDERAARRDALRINERTRALIIVTEGATDPVAYREIVGELPNEKP
jgi:diaminopropionate ammonia-lyase